MLITLAIPAHADRIGSGPAIAPADTPVPIFNPADADIMQESFARGPKPPTDYKNLNGQTYSVSGTFDTSIYTSYYFHPNAQGEFNYSFMFTWQASCGTQRMARVECYDKSSNKMVLSHSFYMNENSNGLYGPSIITGAWKVYNLDPNRTYYLRFYKTFDGINARMIKHAECQLNDHSACFLWNVYLGEKNDNHKTNLYCISIEVDCFNFYDH